MPRSGPSEPQQLEPPPPAAAAAAPPADVLPAPAQGSVATSVPTPTAVATIPVGATPGYMQVAPGGGFAYVANRTANVLTVLDTARNAVTGTIDTATDAVVGTVAVGRSPHALVRHRTRPLLFDADYDDSTVSVTDARCG